MIQTNFLFFLSFTFILALWIFFYLEQRHQEEEHNISRYYNTATTTQVLLFDKTPITNQYLKPYGMEIYHKKLNKNYEIQFEKGNKKKGFKLLNIDDKNILHLYNTNGEIYLIDTQKDKAIVLIHIVFMLFLISQIFLYLKLTSSLNPLKSLADKLKNLQKGDRTPIEINSNYDEIKQIINSYNNSISKIDYMLDTKEMFNKIFMHEMKMPLAKGMFYLKQEPSAKTHEKLQDILNGINEELEEFSQIETLITYQNKIENIEHDFLDILDLAKNRAHIKDENIILDIKEDTKLKGDKEFWTLCIKNLLDNAVKYSTDKKVIITTKEGILFENIGDPLPVDISQDIKKWKIDKNKRHKSSTGYGFGLFIIKNIIHLHNYKLIYNYDTQNKKVLLKIC